MSWLLKFTRKDDFLSLLTGVIVKTHFPLKSPIIYSIQILIQFICWQNSPRCVLSFACSANSEMLQLLLLFDYFVLAFHYSLKMLNEHKQFWRPKHVSSSLLFIIELYKELYFCHWHWCKQTFYLGSQIMCTQNRLCRIAPVNAWSPETCWVKHWAPKSQQVIFQVYLAFNVACGSVQKLGMKFKVDNAKSLQKIFTELSENYSSCSFEYLLLNISKYRNTEHHIYSLLPRMHKFFLLLLTTVFHLRTNLSLVEKTVNSLPLQMNQEIFLWWKHWSLMGYHVIRLILLVKPVHLCN